MTEIDGNPIQGLFEYEPGFMWNWAIMGRWGRMDTEPLPELVSVNNLMPIERNNLPRCWVIA